MIDYWRYLKQLFLIIIWNFRITISLVGSKVLLLPFISNFLKILPFVILKLNKKKWTNILINYK